MSDVLGAGSFDFANSATRSVAFHSSGMSFGNDHAALITRVQGRYTAAQTALDKMPDPTCFLTASAAGFGFEIQKLHKKAQDILRASAHELLLKDTDQLSKDDQRSLVSRATHDSEFSKCFLVASHRAQTSITAI